MAANWDSLIAEQERLLRSENDPAKRQEIQKKIDDFKEAKESSRSSRTTTTGNDSSFFSKILEAATAESTYAPQTQNYGIKDFVDTYKKIKAQDANASVLSNLGGMAKEMAENSIADYIKEQEFLLERVNGQLGLSGELSRDWRDSITEALPELTRIGIGFDELVKSSENLVNSTGRFALVGTETLVRAGEVATAYGMNMADVVESYADFEKVGIGAAQANEAIANAGKRSLELGIQSKNTIKGMQDNLGKLNEYGFTNGVQGLEKMVRRATEVRMSLQSVFTVADKVFDPEGALDLAANLQVLGGAFGEFNDPIRLMYMATNEVEGLQGAIEGVAKGLATYNVETGGFEVTGVNLRQARDLAKQLGITVEELNNIAIATQERLAATTALEGLEINDEQKEFLTNIARMKDGTMQIELLTPELQKQFNGATSIALDRLDSETAKTLLKYQDELKPKDEKDLIRDQVGMVKNIERNLNYLAQLARVEAGKVGNEVFKQVFDEDFKTFGGSSSEFISNMTDEVAKYVKSGSEWSQNLVRDLGDKMRDDKPQTQQQTVGGTVNVNHNLNASTAVGAVDRYFWQNTPNTFDYGRYMTAPADTTSVYNPYYG